MSQVFALLPSDKERRKKTGPQMPRVAYIPGKGNSLAQVPDGRLQEPLGTAERKATAEQKKMEPISGV